MRGERYVILHHTTGGDEHWDLCIEHGARLATWRLFAPPDDRADFPIAADRIADHRKKYLVYEGPLTGGRGQVKRWDHGQALVQERTDERWLVSLRGQRLAGRFTLVRDEEGWQLDRAGGHVPRRPQR